MLLRKTIFLLPLFAGGSQAQTTCPERVDAGLDCISESVADYSKCLINDCPTADQTCTGTTGDADVCADVEAMCTTITDNCCPDCQCGLAWLADCATGDICSDPFTCGSGARKLFEDPQEKKTPAQERQLDAVCLSEAIRLYTECVIKECPTADEACTGTAQDGDTCDDVEATCTKITMECCTPCASQLAMLMDCATGDICPDKFVCGSTPSTEAEVEPTGELGEPGEPGDPIPGAETEIGEPGGAETEIGEPGGADMGDGEAGKTEAPEADPVESSSGSSSKSVSAFVLVVLAGLSTLD